MSNDNQRMQTSNYYARTETNQRENNEDFHAVFFLDDPTEELYLPVLIVADGMGGHEHGEDVSHQVVLKMEDFLRKTIHGVAAHPSPTDYLKQCLLDALKSANDLVQRMIAANGWERAGSTLVIGLVWQDKLIAANLGDSPLWLFRPQTTQLERITQDHSVPGILAQAKLITEEMARYHERRGQLEFFVGSKALPLPAPVYEQTLLPGDLLLLCSDGISGALSSDQLRRILATPSPLPDIAEHLIQAALREGETDNQTLILWRYDGSPRSPLQTVSEPVSTLRGAPSVRSASPANINPPSSNPTLSQTIPPRPPEQLTVQQTTLPGQSLRPRRSLPRRTWTVIAVGAIAGVAVSVWMIPIVFNFFMTRFANTMAAHQPPKSEQLPQFEELQPDGKVMNTRSASGEPQTWSNPQLIGNPSKECNPASVNPGRQDILKWDPNQPSELIAKDSKGCQRRWQLQPAGKVIGPGLSEGGTGR
jgi:protein phosphatase